MEISADISSVNLVINRVSREIYDYLCQTHQIREDELYCVDEELLDARGQRIVNTDDPISVTDAANKRYVDMHVQELSAGVIAVSSDTAGKVRLSSDTVQELSTDLDIAGFIKVGGITARGRKFVEIAYDLVPPAQQSQSMIGQVYMMIRTDFVNHYVQGHYYLLTADLSGNQIYQDITDLNLLSVTYISSANDIRFDSHIGSVAYDEDTAGLSLEVLRM